MKRPPLAFLPMALGFALLAATAAPRAFGQDPVVVQPAPTASQTQTTVTTTSPDQTQTTQTTQTTVTTATAAPVPVRPFIQQNGRHTVEITLMVSHGSVEAYFGRAPLGEKVTLGSAEIRVKLPSTATVTKLASRDKTSVRGPTKITADTPWQTTVSFSEPGRYVFNIVEWDDDPSVAVCAILVDGAVAFSGHGKAEDIDNWPEKTFGAGVRKTGSREIAFDIGE